MSMELSNISLIKLQTNYMRQDRTTQAMCAAINSVLPDCIDAIGLCGLLAHLDSLPENVLDELAYALHVEWYDSAAAIEVKRNLLKNSDKVHMCLATPYAIEQVVQDYFGDGYVEEWFEYNGDPYHFRVITSNPSVTGELATKFEKTLESVKNIRSRLDQIIISMSAEMQFYFGNALHTGDYITVEQVV